MFYRVSGVLHVPIGEADPTVAVVYNNSIADAIADLGQPEEIGSVFAGFQRFLYEAAAA